MNRFLILLFLCLPVLASAAPTKKATKTRPKYNLNISYIVTTNDVSFYLNQPVTLKVSVCDKREQLCTELGKSTTYTYTGTQRAIQFALSAPLPYQSFESVITKRRIHIDDARIKLEVSYVRPNIYSKFVETVILYNDLTDKYLNSNILLKDFYTEATGIIEFSYLKVTK